MIAAAHLAFNDNLTPKCGIACGGLRPALNDDGTRRIVDAQSECRRRWGCDEDSPGVVWRSQCWKCYGTDPECKKCEGGNVVGHKRCPASIVGADAGVGQALRAYMWLDRFSVTPRPGGMLAQSGDFIDAVKIIDAERGALEEAKSKKPSG